MKGQNCSTISTSPEHWPNPSWPLIRAINPEREDGSARGAERRGERRGKREEDEREQNRQAGGVQL